MKTTPGEERQGLPGMAGAKAVDESERTMSLMGGVVEGLPEAGGADFDEPPKRKSLSHGTLLVLGAMLVGGGSLYAMRATQGGEDAGSKEVEARIEQALAKLSNPASMGKDDPLSPQNINGLFKDTDAIVESMSFDLTARQVPIEFVKQNPFVLPIEKSAVAAKGDVKPVVDRRDEVRRKKLATEFKDLKLQTVMDGRVPIAIINGQLLQSGQTIGSFTVKSIYGTNVQLEAGSELFLLSMEEKPGDKGAGR